MAYFCTEPASERRNVTGKSRVLDFFRLSNETHPANRRQPAQPRRKIGPTPTKTVSGIPYWPSRDPIGEKGGKNLYGFVRNDGIDWIDVLGLADQSENNYIKGATNCLGFACGYDDTSVQAKDHSLKEILNKEGFTCTKGIGAKDCKEHCKCKEYLVLYIYGIKEVYEGKGDKLQKAKKENEEYEMDPFVDKGFTEMFLKSEGLDYHALKGGETGYTWQPFHNADAKNLSDDEKSHRQKPWVPTDKDPEYFNDPSRVYEKYCCCKKSESSAPSSSSK